MNLVAFLLLFFLSFTSENDTEKIVWNETRKLSWSDFKAVPNSEADFVASTNSGISFSYSFKFKNDDLSYDFTVESFFYPNESWYKKDLVSPYILRHEQAHFDISELHARKLSKLISEATFTKNIKNEIEPLYRKIETERVAMQQRFDLETDHSTNRDEELRWETFIKQELKAYERWR